MNKMKEMGISNSEAYYSMEYRHGPMSLVDENTLLILLSNEKTEKTDEALMEQMQSFSGVTCGIGPHTDNMKGLRYFFHRISGGCDDGIYRTVPWLLYLSQKRH